MIIDALLVCAIIGLVYRLEASRKLIEQNLDYIKKNKELIAQNSKLIWLINVMLSNSELKIEWEKYKDKLREAGICYIDDNHRNQDIEDPEG